MKLILRQWLSLYFTDNTALTPLRLIMTSVRTLEATGPACLTSLCDTPRIQILFFKKLYLFTNSNREKRGKRERERDLLSTDSKQPPWLGLDQAEVSEKQNKS